MTSNVSPRTPASVCELRGARLFCLAAYVDTGREEFFPLLGSSSRRGSKRTTGMVPRAPLERSRHGSARARPGGVWRVYRGRPTTGPRSGAQSSSRRVVTAISCQPRALHLFHEPRGDAEPRTPPTEPGLSRTTPERAYQRSRLSVSLGRLTFFMGHEGIIRENSAGYQAFDLENARHDFRSMTLLGDPIVHELLGRSDIVRGSTFSARSDGRMEPASHRRHRLGEHGGLPKGDDIDARGHGRKITPIRSPNPRSWESPPSCSRGTGSIGPGLTGRLMGLDSSQTVLVLAQPPGTPTNTRTSERPPLVRRSIWLTSVGYWPYTEEGRGQAEGWDGSNAPHISGEDPLSQRATRLHVLRHIGPAFGGGS